MTATRSDPFTTTDLTLATVLAIEGLEGVLERKKSRSPNPVAQWVFDFTEDVQEIINRYSEGKIAVEPKTFYRKMARTRDELFDFLAKERERE